MVNLTTSVKHFFYINKILGLFFFNSDNTNFIFMNTIKYVDKWNKKISKK